MRFPLTAMLFCAAALAPAAAAPLQPTFDVRVLCAPQSETVDGRRQLIYELHLTNFASTALELNRVDVLDADAAAAPLASWQGEALAARVALPGSAAATRTVAPGMHAVLYIEVALAPGAAAPRALRHRIDFDQIAADARAHGVVLSGDFTVTRREAAALGPPLHGGPWVAVYGADMPRGHRRVIFATDGRARIPARFAIDWIRLDADGHSARGDQERVASWYGYGQEVLAVADATVVAMRDGFPESATLSAVRHAPGDAAGNFVSLDLGDGRYAHYEHLKPGSVRVRVGERVCRGQTIAALGYTGDSVGPHLHFHVSDGATPLAGEGVPFAFAQFTVLGSYASLEAFAQGKPWTPAPPRARARRAERPAAKAVVELP